MAEIRAISARMKTQSIAAAFLLAGAMLANAQPKVSPIELTAAVLIQEAGGEKSTNAMTAVFEVIRNRAIESKTSLSNVVTKKYQFESVSRYGVEGIINKAKNHPKWKKAIEIVKNNHKTSFVKGATHFFNPSIPTPSWAKKEQFVAQIDNHYFYKVENKVVKKKK